LSDESLDQPPRDLALAKDSAGISDAQFMLLAVGETRSFKRSQDPSD